MKGMSFAKDEKGKSRDSSSTREEGNISELDDLHQASASLPPSSISLPSPLCSSDRIVGDRSRARRSVSFPVFLNMQDRVVRVVRNRCREILASDFGISVEICQEVRKG